MVLVMGFAQHQKCHLKFALKFKDLQPFLELLSLVPAQLWMIFGHTPSNYILR
jgi:hypothetical protein